ncbi:MAG: DNA/RNA nuclease SfsA, partial [Treponema sp.]|nr:DNA/RNA nuclease SfsA [Treponema sp.]
MKRAVKTVRVFSNDLEAVFTGRPNRFLITAEDSAGKELACHCPNPGRLIEFFGFRGYDIPGIRLILEKREPGSAARTDATAVGLYYHDGITGKEVTVPLFSSRANRAAELLALDKIIPGLTEVHPEYAIGSSRFDFFCTDHGGRHHLVEVKACSLVEYGVAMFPDAPSERALKHVQELAELSGKGYVCHVLFAIVHSTPRVFIPNLHTDPALAAGLSRLGTAVDPWTPNPHEPVKPAGWNRVLVHAALFRADAQGRAVLAGASVPVDLSRGGLAADDRGDYLVVLELAEGVETEVGSLGTLRFDRGWYVYTGSARKNLTRRIDRHLRKIRKKKHWHLDYLIPFSATLKALPIRSCRSLECDLSRELSALGGKPVRGRNGGGFGSS